MLTTLYARTCPTKPLGLEPNYNFLHIMKYFGSAEVFLLDGYCANVYEIVISLQEKCFVIASNMTKESALKFL